MQSHLGLQHGLDIEMKSILFFLGLSLTFTTNALADCCGKVIKVSDGDTLWLLCDGATNKTKVRLDGVDAPESTQEYGKESAEFASRLVFEKQACLVEKGKDKDGRTLGVVITSDLKVLNNELIKEGFAWHYKQYSKDATLAELEVQAREQKFGLWKSSAPLAPWIYRHPERTETGSATDITPDSAKAEAVANPPKTSVAVTPDTEIVYVTKSGKKYHKAGCGYLNKSSLPISLKDAKEKYTPCSKCN